MIKNGRFANLLDGNALKRKQTAYDEAATLWDLERMRAAFTGQIMRRKEGSGERSSVPVFVLGMPRSGSTLIEQILASHPKVFATGEIDDFVKAVVGFHGSLGERCLYLRPFRGCRMNNCANSARAMSGALKA